MAMTLRIPDDLTQALREAADAQGVSMNAAIVIAISEFIERRNVAAASELATEFVRENRELIDRLGR